MGNEKHEHHHEHMHGQQAAAHSESQHKQETHQIKPEHHEGHENGHAHMIDDFKKRFWISLAATLPVLFLTPMIQMFFGLGDFLRFTKTTIFSGFCKVWRCIFYLTLIDKTVY